MWPMSIETFSTSESATEVAPGSLPNGTSGLGVPTMTRR
jgi:hypothetical protein